MDKEWLVVGIAWHWLGITVVVNFPVQVLEVICFNRGFIGLTVISAEAWIFRCCPESQQ